VLLLLHASESVDMSSTGGRPPRRPAGVSVEPTTVFGALFVTLLGAYGATVSWRRWQAAKARRELQQLLAEVAGRDARIVVTGAGSGIGEELARQFAQHPRVSLLLGCRGGTKRLGRHKTLPLEMLDLDSVQGFAKEAHTFLASGAPGLRLLVNNAGVRAPPEGTTELGVAATWQANFLAPFLLTELLCRLREECPAIAERPLCVINVASSRESESRLEQETLDSATRGCPGADEQYADSKRALLLWTAVRAQSLAFKGHIFVHATCPGQVDTRLGQYDIPDWRWRLSKPLRVLRFGTVAEGALRVAKPGLHPQAIRKFGSYVREDSPREDLVVWRMPEKQLSMKLVKWANFATDVEARHLNRWTQFATTAERSRSVPDLMSLIDEDRWSSPERRLAARRGETRRLMQPIDVCSAPG